MRISNSPLPNFLPYRQLRFGLIAFFATLLILVINSCTDELNPSKDLGYNPKFETYYKLVSFHEAMEGLPQTYPLISPRTNFTATEIRDNIEGALNLVYTDANLTWASYYETIDTFTISLSGGYAPDYVVDVLYDRVVDSASAFFYRQTEPDKFPYLYDVEILGSSSTYVQIAVEHVIGRVHRDPTPFGSNDYWSVYTNGGHCSPMSGGEGDAAKHLNDALTDYYTPYSCVVWSNLTFIDTEELEEFGWLELNPNDPTTGDFIIDYRSLYIECTSGAGCDALTNNGVFCLDPDEMNYYYSSIKGIYDDYIYDSGLNLRMSRFGLFTSVGGTNIYYWTGQNWFGTRNNCDTGGSFPYALPHCC